MTARPFPTRSADLTVDWLDATLRQAGVLGASRVAHFETHPTSHRGGTSETCIVTPHYDPPVATAPAKLVAKFASPDPAVRAAVRDYGLYRREVAFYANYAATCGLPTPRCFAAQHTPADDTCVLLLEFLADARPREISPTAPDEIAAIVPRLAAFHARWWNRPGEIPDIDSELAPPAVERRLAKVTRAFTRLHPEHRSDLGETTATLLEFWLAHAHALADYTRRRPLTLCHGSLHRGQILFADNSPTSFHIIDWQSVALDLAANDLARLVVTGLSPEQRQQHEPALLELYHRALLAHGVNDYPITQLQDDYRLALVNLLVFHVQIFADYPVAIVAKHWRGAQSVWDALFHFPAQAAHQHDVLPWLRRTIA